MQKGLGMKQTQSPWALENYCFVKNGWSFRQLSVRYYGLNGFLSGFRSCGSPRGGYGLCRSFALPSQGDKRAEANSGKKPKGVE